MQNDLPDDLIRVAEAARLAGNCHRSTIHRWILTQVIRGWKIVGRKMVSRAEVLGAFRRCGRETPAPTAKLESERRKECRRVLEEAGIA